jgi:hypothetical protein
MHTSTQNVLTPCESNNVNDTEKIYTTQNCRTTYREDMAVFLDAVITSIPELQFK